MAHAWSDPHSPEQQLGTALWPESSPPGCLPSRGLWKVLSEGKLSEQLWVGKTTAVPGCPEDTQAARRERLSLMPQVEGPGLGSPLQCQATAGTRSSPEETLFRLDVNNSRVRGWDTWRGARSSRRGSQRRGRLEVGMLLEREPGK